MSSQENLSSLITTRDPRDPLIDLSGGFIVKQKLGGTSYVDKIIQDQSIADVFKEVKFLKLPSQIFNPYRLLLLIALWRWGSLDFPALRAGIQMKSDGNLANHLRVLEDLELISYNKEFVNRKPKTFYELTEKGEKILDELKFYLKKFLSENEVTYEST